MVADFNKAKTEAERLLSDLQITRPPVNPELIAKKLGLDVVYGKFSPAMSEKISGYLDSRNNRIVVNGEIHPNRAIYTIAHEIGHYILHKEYAKSEDYKVLLRTNDHNGVKPDHEKEADTFAAHLLAPTHMVKKYSEVLGKEGLAQLFCVSREMMGYRLQDAVR